MTILSEELCAEGSDFSSYWHPVRAMSLVVVGGVSYFHTNYGEALAFTQLHD